MTTEGPPGNRDQAPVSRGWARWVGFAAGALLGVVLTYSAWGKGLDPHGVGELYVRRGLVPASVGGAVIVGAVVLEAALGFALLTGFRRTPVLAVASVLMAAFFGLTLYEYFFPSKDASSCGCFGNLIVRTPGQAVLGDGGFLLLAGLAWLGRPRAAASRWRWWPAVLGGLAGLGLTLAAPRLPVDDWATRLRPGVRVAALRIDEIIPELQRGKSLVLLVDRADERTRQEIARVNEELALKGGPVAVFGLAEDNARLAAEFTWTAGPAFDVRGAPFTLIKPLFRTMPRSFLVENGVVLRTWNGIPGDAVLTALAEGRAP